MTLTSAAMSLSPRVWFIGTAVAILLLGLAENHVTTAFEAPAAPTELTEEHEVWSRGGLQHIYLWLDCPAHHASEKALEIHNAAVWKQLKTTYQSIVHADINSLPPPSMHESLHGYQVPIEIKKSTADTHTLGVFAKEAIPKGTLVWKSTFTAQFTTGTDFRAFLKALPENLACDVIDWAYPRMKAEQPVMCVDLDHGSLTNSGEESEDCNLKVKGERTGCDLEFYASRGIAAGEELLIDHDFHEEEEALVPLGLAHPNWHNHLEDYEHEDYDDDEDSEHHDLHHEGDDDDDDEEEEEL